MSIVSEQNNHDVRFTRSATFATPIRLGTANVTAAGSAQTNAASLTGALNFVSGANIDKGVILPVGSDGMRVELVNSATGTNTLKLYPNGSGTINGGTAGASVTIPATNSATCLCSGTAQAWTVVKSPLA